MADQTDDKQEADTVDQCGIIMPISGTATHSSQHWERVKTLLHRAVTGAKLQPLDVWTNSAFDRITTRIVANIYSVPIAICDISGLNANVMLETGLRLASKRPTIIVADDKIEIPFDIRDFEVVTYPRDTNIIDMELFLGRLTKMITERLAADRAGTYKSFLGDVTIDVVEPHEREITIEQLFERRLDDIDRTLRDLTRTREGTVARTSFTPVSALDGMQPIHYDPYENQMPYRVHFRSQPPEAVMNRIREVIGVGFLSESMDATGAYGLTITGKSPRRAVVMHELNAIFAEHGVEPMFIQQ